MFRLAANRSVLFEVSPMSQLCRMLLTMNAVIAIAGWHTTLMKRAVGCRITVSSIIPWCRRALTNIAAAILFARAHRMLWILP